MAPTAPARARCNIRFTTRSGTNQLHGQRVLLPAPRCAQREHLVQQPRPDADPATGKAPKTELRQYQPGTRVGGPIVIPGLVRRPRQGVLLRQLRGDALAEQRHADAHDPAPARAAGHLPLQRQRPASQTVDLLALAARNGQIATLDPTVARLLARHPQRRRATGAVDGSVGSAPAAVRRSRLRSRAITPAPTVRIDYNLSTEPPADGVVQLSAHQLGPRHDEQPADRLSRASRSTAASSRPATRHPRRLRSTLRLEPGQRVPRRRDRRRDVLLAGEVDASMWGGTSVADQDGIHSLSISAARPASPTPASRRRRARAKRRRRTSRTR